MAYVWTWLSCSIWIVSADGASHWIQYGGDSTFQSGDQWFPSPVLPSKAALHGVAPNDELAVQLAFRFTRAPARSRVISPTFQYSSSSDVSRHTTFPATDVVEGAGEEAMGRGDGGEGEEGGEEATGRGDGGEGGNDAAGGSGNGGDVDAATPGQTSASRKVTKRSDTRFKSSRQEYVE